jgi:hypothetical protein
MHPRSRALFVQKALLVTGRWSLATLFFEELKHVVPFGMRIMYKTALLAALVAIATVSGCEAAKPAGQTPARKDAGKPAALLKLPGFTGGDYATTFTILCMEAKGPDGARLVEQMAAGLRNVKGLDPKLVRVDSANQKHRLFYGACKGQVDKATDQFVAPPKAREELNLIRGMECTDTRLGTMRPFQLATIVDMPSPDPGPAEWDLRNAQGLYTLQICYCFDKPGLPNHKDVAVAICKALRERGEEAWYLHNDRVSVVTVGHFDASAVQKDADGKLSYSPAVIALQNKREEFKYNTENLQKVSRVIAGQRITSPSMLIYIREPANDSAGSKAKPTPGPAANPPGNR